MNLGPLFLNDYVLFALCVVAIATDWREQKIKNWLTFPVMGWGCLFWVFATPQWYGGLVGVLVAFLVAMPFWRFLPALKAGDVKMLMAGGALLGAEAGARAVLLTLVLGLPAGILVLAVKGRLGRLWRFYQRKEGDLEPTVVMHAPVVAAGLLAARFQDLPNLW